MYSVVQMPNQLKPQDVEAPEQDAGLFGVDRPGVAWDWMMQTGQPPEGDDWVRPQVSEAWYRCIEEYRLSPRTSLLRPHAIMDFESGGRTAPATNLDVRTALATMAFNLQPVLRDTSVSLLLADSAGTLIHALDAGSNLGPMGRRLVRLGESWNELIIGNNGLGTAAVLREPVAFDGKEHFSSVLHPFATVGHPLFAHDGGLVALLGLITDQRSSAQTLLGFVRIAGYLIETNLFECQAPGAFMLRMRLNNIGAGLTGQDCLLDGLISLDEEGRIVGATRTGLNLLRAECHSNILSKKVETLLGVAIGDLRACASRGEPIELEIPEGWRLKAELIVRRRPEKDVVQPSRSFALKETGRASAGPVLGRRGKSANAEPWRDAVLEAALQKAVNLQKQKIPMLITGESGVGKDHLVRRIHAEGVRKGRPLVLVNCAAIPRDLISSELFGYVPGSFTGARTGGKTGKFVEAHTGVLFLDEIGDMALDLQTALLCALDSSEIVPVGGSRPVTVDVQVIAATNSDLPDCVRKGAFRRDLYYRLNGAQFWLPPLRERPDKLGLIEHLWEQEVKAQYVNEHKALSAEVWDIFERHPWPGNIRELRNVLRSCLAMTSGPETLVSDLPNDFLREMSDSAQAEEEGEAGLSSYAKWRPSPESKALADWEADAIRSALAKTAGNISESARQLGITRATLYHKMARLGLRK
ncbi:Sigma-54-dependent Fis family transcriptional regulator (MmoR) [Methylocella tundrae]|uniref:Sigma-54-dependent Fis family transcriptional regulator (MmoR) n=1 Tax=Methylocella tundrae TaxID=227605 RepID=A0A8B6M745_METTU|nr:sigma-54-dependent Fis family transcriptional regulator [Methylocella tundrae]VTZ50163.1 Sigma-54-dependent Fis family transcriptional regulator (MmoR) [Methylocella tundrae]